MEVLQLDVSGRPQAWISAKEAASSTPAMAWPGRSATPSVLRGGVQRRTGLQSRIEVHPIIAVRGAIPSKGLAPDAGAVQPKLFARDRQVCAYCGHHLHLDELTREHIVPTSRGGLDSWMNCITACRPCNGRKGNRLPRRPTWPALPALRAQPARGHDPARPAHPGRPDGVPARQRAAHQPPACLRTSFFTSRRELPGAE